MATQTERRAATRQRLLDAAAQLLCEHGTAGCTTAAVGAKAGLSNGALFRHFPTRNALLAATVEHVFDRLRADYVAAFHATGAAERTTRHLLTLLWDVMADPHLAGVYDVYAQARTDPSLRTAIEPVARAHVADLHALARALAAELPGADPDLVDAAVWMAILAMQGQVLNQTAMPDHDAGTAIVALLTDVADTALGRATAVPA